MSENTTLTDILGLAVEVTGFTDDKPRKAYPVKMKDFPGFIKAFASINKRLWANYIMDENGQNLHSVISMSFKDTTVDDILENSTAKTFDAIFETIKSINGVNFEDLTPKNGMEVIGFKEAVNGITNRT